MLAACSTCTVLPLTIAPTTVPSSSRSLPVCAISPPSSEAITWSSASSGFGVGVPTPAAGFFGPWWWPVASASARCLAFGSGSNSASAAPVSMMSPGAPCSLTTLPVYGEGTSTTALAVSIEHSGASSLMLSPTFTCHSTTVASGRPSPRSGR